MRRLIPIACAAVVLAGCATAPPPALTQFSRTDCVAAPVLANAISLTPKKEQKEFVVTTPLGAQSPCLSGPGGARPYAVYALPSEFADKTVTVGGLLEMARLVPPSVSLLGRDGRVTRTFTPEDYLFRGQVYSVLFTPRADDAFVLVSVDPARVGQKYDSIFIGTQTSATAVGGVPVSWTSGTDAKQSRTFSYEGSIQVTVNDSEVKKAR